MHFEVLRVAPVFQPVKTFQSWYFNIRTSSCINDIHVLFVLTRTLFWWTLIYHLTQSWSRFSRLFISPIKSNRNDPIFLLVQVASFSKSTQKKLIHQNYKLNFIFLLLWILCSSYFFKLTLQYYSRTSYQLIFTCIYALQVHINQEFELIIGLELKSKTVAKKPFLGCEELHGSWF